MRAWQDGTIRVVCSLPLFRHALGPSSVRLQVHRMAQRSPCAPLLTGSRIQCRVPRRTLAPHPALQFPIFLACGLSFAPVLDAGEERVGSPHLAYLDVLASRKPASLCRWAALRPVEPVFPSSDSSGSSVTRGLAPRRPSRRALLPHYQREVGGPLLPSPPSLGGAGLSEVTPSLRLYW